MIRGMSYLVITELFGWTTVKAETKILLGAVRTEEGDSFLDSPRISMLGWTQYQQNLTLLHISIWTRKIKPVLQAQLGLGVRLKLLVIEDGMVTRDGAAWTVAFAISSG